MKLALECPPILLKDIQPLGDFDFILAHLVLGSIQYRQFYSSSRRFKILDNSVNELLHPLTLPQLSGAANIVNPDLITPPDHLGSSEATGESLDRALDLWDRDRLLPVVQGSSPAEVVRFAEHLKRIQFTRVSVPYDISGSRTDSLEVMSLKRQAVVKYLSFELGFSEIHLLGMTTLGELPSYSQDSRVKSVDTGSPVLHGLLGIEFGKGKLLPKSLPTMNQIGRLEVSEKTDLSLVRYNIGYLKNLLGSDDERS